MCIGCSVGLEREFVGSGHLVAEAATAAVLAAHVELHAINSANEAVRQVQTVLRTWVFGEVIVCLELVQVFGWSDDVESSIILLQHATLALERACNKWLRGLVILVGEVDVLDSTLWCARVNENVRVALDKSIPLEVWWDALSLKQSA